MRLSSVALRCLPILLVASLLPGAFRMVLPASLGALAAFLLSMSLSLVLVVVVSMFIYILTFVTMSSLGSRLVLGIAAEFLSGQILPIPLMPQWLQTMLNFFPYRYISDLPFRLYSGHISGAEAAVQIGVQLAWIVGLLLLGKLAFRRVMRRIVIQGG
jgi:ABC-2 type transport system permease protein